MGGSHVGKLLPALSADKTNLNPRLQFVTDAFLQYRSNSFREVVSHSSGCILCFSILLNSNSTCSKLLVFFLPNAPKWRTGKMYYSAIVCKMVTCLAVRTEVGMFQLFSAIKSSEKAESFRQIVGGGGGTVGLGAEYCCGNSRQTNPQYSGQPHCVWILLLTHDECAYCIPHPYATLVHQGKVTEHPR